MKTLAIALALVGVLFLASSASGRGKPVDPGSCYYSSGVVYGSNLPTEKIINFLRLDASDVVIDGFVLGFTFDGTWTVHVPTPAAGEHYQFISKTWGKDGKFYDIYASCSS